MKTLGLWCQPFAPRVLGLGRHRGDARSFVLLPVALLAGLAAVVHDLTLGASAQRGAPALLAAEEAGEEVDPLDGLLFGAGLLVFAELLVGRGVLCGAVVVVFPTGVGVMRGGKEGGGWRIGVRHNLFRWLACGPVLVHRFDRRVRASGRGGD